MPTYYEATANDRRLRAPLFGQTTADVCVIGGGFTGISAALALAERNLDVVVLEAERIGFGASGRNGGQIVNGYSRDLSVIERRYGMEKARALGAMSLEGGSIIRSRVKKYGIDCDLAAGNFLAALNQRQMGELEQTIARSALALARQASRSVKTRSCGMPKLAIAASILLRSGS